MTIFQFLDNKGVDNITIQFLILKNFNEKIARYQFTDFSFTGLVNSILSDFEIVLHDDITKKEIIQLIHDNFSI